MMVTQQVLSKGNGKRQRSGTFNTRKQHRMRYPTLIGCQSETLLDVLLPYDVCEFHALL